MASLNDFKLLNLKCNSYFKILENEIGKKIKTKKDSDQERFGFYLYMLESICNIKDTLEQIELITDTDFNETLFNDKSNDLGIDAVYIDDVENQISLFNFKFRESFKPIKQQTLNDPFISTKFTNAIVNNDTKHLQGKLKHFAVDILAHLNSKDIWTLKLYLVSNESDPLDVNDKSIELLESTYDLEVIPIALPAISNYMSVRPEPINASLIVDNEAIMSYSENALSSAKSFIIRLTIPELIRITCSNKSRRVEYNMEDYAPLTKENMDFSVLFDNVRGFLGDTKYNQNIIETLKKQPSRFFMYNNGITIAAKDISSVSVNGHRKMKIIIQDLQVVNGGQTLRTIHNFNSQNENNLINSLLHSEILIRVFNSGTSTDNLINKIAEYTNSQNAISMIDLKSLAHEQILIEQFLDESNIIYARKAGDTGLSSTKIYTHKISIEKFAQLLFSIQGFPEKASNQKKKIFDKYYDQTFNNDTFNISDSASIVNRYYEIKAAYENEPSYKSSDQKIFFILYVDKYLNTSIEEKIKLLEDTLKEFRASENISDARKLIQIGFKDLIDKKIL